MTEWWILLSADGQASEVHKDGVNISDEVSGIEVVQFAGQPPRVHVEYVADKVTMEVTEPNDFTTNKGHKHMRRFTPDTWARFLLLALAIIFLLVLFTRTASATIATEPGAVINDDGTCLQDGQPGLVAIDGQCVTTDDYDDLFSQEALHAVPSLSDPSRSVAEVYGITAGPASTRVRVFQGVSQPTFAEYVTNAHQVAL